MGHERSLIRSEDIERLGFPSVIPESISRLLQVRLALPLATVLYAQNERETGCGTRSGF